ncbi:hypothetical protein C3747_22g304 [Trypanosoma cruzi]|uniref:C3H1-type domain-containing protein n=2 Tax=Trypanosoma cruzi TaxID=5693 RepID=Q4DVF6_TRYCC|nr:hypothetical protein, conserved [Trypanosoma cruzi]EAN96520.1 hypothetical protein, conserved [Trypanosoma cruzi]PWV16607.1 hypothetical protein C3747_22g304 [Trypanosoma cruzi]|eukprot:XP_818371.1 hypothetical protein [Trypanosoma cruzi strain CL Brener]
MLTPENNSENKPDLMKGGSRHLSKRADGTLCMVVVDPATRKLLIPCNFIYATRAQHRATIPSLCQLFLHGRCRQGTQCHQVHASLDAVVALRSRVGKLPCCCVFHGDEDIADVLNERSWLSKVVLYVPEVSFEGGYIPLSRVSYTVALQRILKEKPDRAIYELREESTCGENDVRPGNSRLIIDASDQSLCRLHIFDRCRYAEECRFLHLCKEVTSSSYTSQGHGDANFNSRGHHNTSVFTAISLQQQLRGYPIHCSKNEPMVGDEHSLPLPLAPNNSWRSSADSSWSVHCQSKVPGTKEMGRTRTAMMAQSRMQSISAPKTPEGSFSAAAAEGSLQGLSYSETNYNMNSSSSDPGLLFSVPSPKACVRRVPPSIKISLSLCESDADMDNDRPAGDDLPLSSSPEVSSRHPVASRGGVLRRHWQHNPYSSTPFIWFESGAV